MPIQLGIRWGKSILLVSLALVTAAVFLLAVAIPAFRRAAKEELFRKQVTEPFGEVASGGNYASVRDEVLLNKLAADNRCVANLEEIVFWSFHFEPSHASDLARLKNLKRVGFYCCNNVEAVVPGLLALKLDSLWFELSLPTPESLELLGQSRTMKELGVEQVLTRREAEVLKSFPPEVKITTSFPLDASE